MREGFREPGRRVALLVVVAALVLPPTTGALPTPGQDDAGSGGDAGDTRQTALPIAAGTYQGNLSALVDTEDVYRFVPPQPSLIEVHVTSAVDLDVELVGPDGRSHQNGPPEDVEDGTFAIAAPPGNWTLHVVYPELTSLDTEVPYTFSLGFRPRDHLLRIDAEALHNATLQVPLPDADPAWLRLRLGPRDAWAGGAFGRAQHLQIVGNGSVDWFSYLEWSVGGTGPNAVWTHNVGPRDTRVPLLEPRPGPSVFTGPTQHWRWPEILPDGGFELSVGVASTHGADVEGWVLWDGAPASVERSDGARMIAATASDFEGEGQGFQVGPYGQAEDLRVAWNASHDATLGVVDAETPDLAREPTRMTARPPQGNAPQLVDADKAWWVDETGTGRWSVGLDHTGGMERSHVRFLAASFPIDVPDIER